MNWKAKYIQPSLINGTARLKRKFAWVPTTIKGDVVWLAHFEILQVYTVQIIHAIIDNKQVSIEYGTWLDVETRIIK